MPNLILSEEQIIIILDNLEFNDKKTVDIKIYLYSILWSLGYTPNNKEEQFYYDNWEMKQNG